MVFFTDRIQIISILFSLSVFGFIFWLVKNKKVKEEYSLLWFATALVFIYMSLDRYAVDRLGNLFGISYNPMIILLIISGFLTLVLVHITVVITRLSNQNKSLIQGMGLTKLKQRLDKDSSAPPWKNSDVLVIVPAYNEELAIAKVIEELKGLQPAPDVLVVNDGSFDRTGRIAKQTEKALVIDLPDNLGIGGAVQTGFKFATAAGYDFAVQFDGDGQHVAREIPKLLKTLAERDADVVIGSRFLERHSGFQSTFSRRIGIKVFQIVNSLLIRQTVTDNTSGFRAYNRRSIVFLAKHYPVDYPEPEAVILLGRNKFRMVEVPAEMRERQTGGSSISGIYNLYYMIKVLLAILMTALRKPLQQR